MDIFSRMGGSSVGDIPASTGVLLRPYCMLIAAEALSLCYDSLLAFLAFTMTSAGLVY